MSSALRQPAVPLYARVKQYILARIEAGEWADGGRLPSEHELVAALGVSRMTVNRALRELSDKGLISRIQGVGTFVATPPSRAPLLEIRDIAEDIESRGHRHTLQLVTLESVRADEDLCVYFDARPGAKLFHSTVVHFEDDTAVQLEERYVAPSFAPEYVRQDFARSSTTDYLKSIAPPTEVENTVIAAAPDERTCRLLQIPASEPCLRLLRRTWVGGVPATYTVLTYPGSRYSLGGRHRTGDGSGHA